MLFRFGIFWKTILTVLCAWALFVAFGFEFTIVTMLSFLIAFNYKEIK